MTPTATAASRLDGASTKITRRYADAYRVAQTIIFVGKLMKFAGVLVAALVFFAGMLGADSLNASTLSEIARPKTGRTTYSAIFDRRV